MQQKIVENEIIFAPTKGYEKRQFKIIAPLDVQRLLYKATPSYSNIHYKYVTLKIIQKLDEYQIVRITKVLEILQSQKACAQIVTVFDYFETQNQFYIVMEYGEQTLKEYLQNNKGISLIQKLKYCQQICESIQFIHDNGYSHGDVRTENFVMQQKQNQYFVKLKDFGIMSDEPTEEYQQPQIEELVNQFYIAPVYIKQEKYDKKSDIWSLGCVFCEIFAGKQLFNFNTNDSNLNVSQDIIPAIQNIMIPQQTKETIIQMMSSIPQNRPETQKILSSIIESYFALEKQYEIIPMYEKQDNLNEWVEELKNTLQDSYNMDQNQISNIFNKIIVALQKQQFSLSKSQNNFQNQNQFFQGTKQQEKFKAQTLQQFPNQQFQQKTIQFQPNYGDTQHFPQFNKQQETNNGQQLFSFNNKQDQGQKFAVPNFQQQLSPFNNNNIKFNFNTNQYQ